MQRQSHINFYCRFPASPAPLNSRPAITGDIGAADRHICLLFLRPQKSSKGRTGQDLGKSSGLGRRLAGQCGKRPPRYQFCDTTLFALATLTPPHPHPTPPTDAWRPSLPMILKSTLASSRLRALFFLPSALHFPICLIQSQIITIIIISF